MGQDQSSVFDLAAVAAASNGGNNDPLLPPARFIGEPQKPSKMPYNKYVAYDKQVPFDYPERTWPGKRLQRAPRWCSVDLRDGNQALVNPMDSERKLRFWNMLISMGFKEIEVGFPSASETDYDFIRLLIERELIPDDVTIVVLTQAREHLMASRSSPPMRPSCARSWRARPARPSCTTSTAPNRSPAPSRIMRSRCAMR